jgi:succinate dehydrogenase (ubiquinone) cytochrome b560 subunit
MSLTGRIHACILRGPRPTASILRVSPMRSAFSTSLLQRTKTPPALNITPPQRFHMSTSSRQPATVSSKSETIIAQQRLRRPLSPHLSIYRPQITSTLSVLMRITGLVMSGSFCLYPLLYLASPFLGIDVSVASLAGSFGGLPAFIKFPVKFAAAWTFAFHGFNSLRFLTWDMAKGITNKNIAQTGWAVVILSFVSAAALALV